MRNIGEVIMTDSNFDPLDSATHLPGTDFSKERVEQVYHERVGSNAEHPSRSFGRVVAEHMAETIDRELVTVGDLDSDAKGSGARKSEGKLALDLIPIRYWQAMWTGNGKKVDHTAYYAIEQLRKFQEGDDTALKNVFELSSPYEMEQAVRVLEFGAKKYKAWNWAKGMAWSVPTGCALRHAKATFDGEKVDPDSGEQHMAHILCNLMMLDWYVQHYPEGDDRTPV